MNKLTEDLLQYIWKNGLFNIESPFTTDGLPVKIVTFGVHNHDSGPDFFNAKIKIGETLWVGNVEIHLTSSDWIRHNHHKNNLYDSVILHVVAKSDCEIKRTNGSIVPELVINVDQEIINRYSMLCNIEKSYSCIDHLHKLDPIFIKLWLERIFVERLEYKTEMISSVLEKNVNNWDDVFYRMLFRSFGANVNAQAFELLAASLPLWIVLKHKDSLFQLEALLFGQAGFLCEIDSDFEKRENTFKNVIKESSIVYNYYDSHYQSLLKEYQFLKAKYNLSPMDIKSWKLMRMRPINFPTIRMAQLAGILQRFEGLFSKCTEKQSVKDLLPLFDSEVSVYWFTHYTFGHESNFNIKKLGKNSIEVIILNAVIPLLYQYGKSIGNDDFFEKSMKFVNEMPFEINHLTKPWIGLIDKQELSAFYSQAIIHLYKNYCEKRLCLQCAIGDKLIRSTISRS